MSMLSRMSSHESILYIHKYHLCQSNEPVESTKKVQYPNYVSSCYSSSSTICVSAIHLIFHTADKRTETTLPPISPKRISLIRSSTPIAPGKSFLLARTSNGTDWSDGRPSRACSSDVAVGRDFVWESVFVQAVSHGEGHTSAASTT